MTLRVAAARCGPASLGAGGLAVLLSATSAFAFSVSYDQTTTSGGFVLHSKVLLKDERFRVETEMVGTTNLVLRTEQGTFSYFPAEHLAMRMPVLDASQQPVERAGAYLGYLTERHATRLRSEPVHGTSCDVYQYTDPATQRTTIVWVWVEKQFPLRIEHQTPEGLVTIEVANVQFDAPAPDETFQLPAGTRIMENDSPMDLERPANDEENSK